MWPFKKKSILGPNLRLALAVCEADKKTVQNHKETTEMKETWNLKGFRDRFDKVYGIAERSLDKLNSAYKEIADLKCEKEALIAENAALKAKIQEYRELIFSWENEYYESVRRKM